jgi:hypothetical protein
MKPIGLDDEVLRLRMGVAGLEKYNYRFRIDHLAPKLYRVLASGETGHIPEDLIAAENSRRVLRPLAAGELRQ